MKLKAVDFFAGAGGLSYGLQTAGIKVLGGIDIDAECKTTYERNNRGSKFLCKDITKYTPKQLADDLKIEKNDTSLIFAACAPCQYWTSIQTSRSKSKKTRTHLLEFEEFIKYFKPGFVVVENVPALLTRNDSPLWHLVSTLFEMRYIVECDVVDMSRHGVPQTRRRFTLLASRVSDIQLPKPSSRTQFVSDTIGAQNGFPRISAGTIDSSLFKHSAANLSPTNLKRIKLTPNNGGDRSTWQRRKNLKLECFESERPVFSDSYGRMWWDRPAPTITTKFYSISNGRFGHPEENRGISLREGASLQTFPKSYVFASDNIATVARMIGNAVPPKFARELGKAILKSIEYR